MLGSFMKLCMCEGHQATYCTVRIRILYYVVGLRWTECVFARVYIYLFVVVLSAVVLTYVGNVSVNMVLCRWVCMYLLYSYYSLLVVFLPLYVNVHFTVLIRELTDLRINQPT